MMHTKTPKETTQEAIYRLLTENSHTCESCGCYDESILRFKSHARMSRDLCTGCYQDQITLDMQWWGYVPKSANLI